MNNRRVTLHFIDGTELSLEWPKQVVTGAFKLEAAVEKAIRAEQWAIEVDGALMIIQTKNVKFAEVIPAPEKLPEDVMRGGRRVE
jgi:hypothetical protein